MTTFYSFFNWLIIFIYWFIIAIVTMRILMKRRAVTSAMAWLLVIYMFPLVGIITYLFFGELYLGKRRAERAYIIWPYTYQWLNNLKKFYKNIFSNEHSDVASSLFKLCQNRQGISGVKCDQLKLLTNAHDVMNSLIQDINLARKTIEIVFYIWHPGGLADNVASSLIAASKRGVNCRLMLDSAGSIIFFRSNWVKKMKQAGIHIVEALQVSLWRVFLRRMDLRQHRKIVLIDNYIVYTGSMNLVDPKCFKQNAGVGQWVDLMVRMKGPIATIMGIVYSFDWEIETGKRILPPDPNNIKILDKTKKHTIQVIASGPGFPQDMIHQALLTAVYSARKQLTLTTPYFVPSDDLLHAICTAALRNVDVSIIIPRNNDSILVSWASKSFFSELLEAGVKIYQFEDNLLHTKSVLIDQELSLIGTANFDMRSLWLNFEITVVIDDLKFGNNLANLQKSYIKKSKLLDASYWEKRSLWERIIERLFYFLSPLL